MLSAEHDAEGVMRLSEAQVRAALERMGEDTSGLVLPELRSSALFHTLLLAAITLRVHWHAAAHDDARWQAAAAGRGAAAHAVRHPGEQHDARMLL